MIASAEYLVVLSSPVDREAVLDRVDGDVALLREITEIYLNEAPVMAGDIATAIASRDASALESAAHNLKGCILNFGATAAVSAAYRLEQMGRHKNLDDAAEALTELRFELDRLRPALLDLLS